MITVSWIINDYGIYRGLSIRLDMMVCIYTRLLRFALNVAWKDKWTNTRLYNLYSLTKDKGLPKLSDKLRVRRMKLADH